MVSSLVACLAKQTLQVVLLKSDYDKIFAEVPIDADVEAQVVAAVDKQAVVGYSQCSCRLSAKPHDLPYWLDILDHFFLQLDCEDQKKFLLS